MKELSRRKMVVVSNRGPYSFRKKPGGGVRLERAVSGLVTALEPAIIHTGGVWISWGSKNRRVTVPPGEDRYVLRQLFLSPHEVKNYYRGFANRALWPLCHGFLGRTHFAADQWRTYERANQKFADAVLEEMGPGDLVWVHDYQLALVPGMVRRKRPGVRIAHFWHIPFPSCEMFSTLPWRKEVLLGLLGSNLLGFQVKADVDSFLLCCKRILGARINKRKGTVLHDGFETQVRAFPISIDFDFFDSKARETASIAKALHLRSSLGSPSLILGVDRLDYSKGICERLLAIRKLLQMNPEVRGKVTLIQISVPSRTRVPEYIQEKREIDELVGHINGEFSDGIWIPVRYIYGSLSQKELVAYYLAADVALLTPLRDGMNLVAKEYVAAHVDESGVLVLSEFTGAAEELKGALIVNPYDITGVADVLHRALNMPLHEKRRRMRMMRKQVRRNNVFRWLENFLSVSDSRSRTRSA
jgi:trehalose 6-phosphate synthase